MAPFGPAPSIVSIPSRVSANRIGSSARYVDADADALRLRLRQPAENVDHKVYVSPLRL